MNKKSASQIGLIYTLTHDRHQHTDTNTTRKIEQYII